MLAAAVDHLAIGNWMFSAVNRDEDSPMPEAPEPIPRPGAGPEERESAGEPVHPGSGEFEIARFFNGDYSQSG